MKRKLKVLVYTTLFPNHLQPNNAIFIKHRMFQFARLEDIEIKVVAPIPYCPPWPALGKWYRYSQIETIELMEGIEVFHPKYPLIPKMSMAFHGISLFLSSVNLLKKIYHKFPFDLIDGHYIYPDGLAAVLLGKVFKKPVVLSARGSDINQFAKFKTIKPMIRWALKYSDHLISVCKALKEGMIHVGAESDKIRVIPNGVDIHQFYPERREEAREKLSLVDSDKIIVSVGSLIPRKGFHVIIDAMSVILDKIPQAHLCIVGEGPYRSRLEQRLEHLGLNRSVTLVGERPNAELKTWYSAADVFCLASSREGWANVIMESLACGTPVVATNVWGAPEILTSPDVGILAERSPESISQGIITALGRQWDRGLIREHVAKRTWDVVAGEVKEVFDSIVPKN